MADLLLLTPEPGGSADVLPALTLLSHRVRALPHEPASLLAPDCDVLVIDGRHDLARARATCQLIAASGIDIPVLLVLGDGGLSVVRPDWGTDDIVLTTAGPAEVDARIRLMLGRARDEETSNQIEAGDLTIDASGYVARLRGEPLDLTFKEFELLKHLSQHPGRVFTRAQLLQEVWGYDYFGGTRTVDVHIRRLRSKFGPEHDHLIGTVRNVGYRFDLPRTSSESAPDAGAESD